MDGMTVQNINVRGNSLSSNKTVRLYGQFGYARDWYVSSVNKSDNINEIEEKFNKVVSQQGLVGKCCDFVKNKFHLKYGSDDVSEKIKLYNQGQISKEEAQKALSGYINGHKKVLDFFADWGSTAIGAGAFALATTFLPVTLPAGLAIAALTGGAFKCCAKLIDASTGDRPYKTAGYDFITGAINGVLSPIVNGIGNIATKHGAKLLGVNVATKDVKRNFVSVEKYALLERVLLYPKQILEGKFFKRLAVFASGKAFRGISKFGFALLMREAAFSVLSGKNLKGENSILKGFMVFSNEEMELLKDKLDASTIDISNDVYDTGENE